MKHLEITVGDEDRVIEITDYTISNGSKGHFYPTYDCGGCPPEPACIEDLTAIWQDTKAPLTDAEFETYCERMEDAIWEYNTDE